MAAIYFQDGRHFPVGINVLPYTTIQDSYILIFLLNNMIGMLSKAHPQNHILFSQNGRHISIWPTLKAINYVLLQYRMLQYIFFIN